MRLELVSRTAPVDRVVDEMTMPFTHDVEIPWVLPSVAPTGRRVVVPLVAMIGIHDGLIDSEHIYWDQASVGLLDPTGLPVIGVKQAAAVATGAGVELFNALLMEPGSDIG